MYALMLRYASIKFSRSTLNGAAVLSAWGVIITCTIKGGHVFLFKGGAGKLEEEAGEK